MNNFRFLPWLFALSFTLAFLPVAAIIDINHIAFAAAETVTCGPNCVRVEVVAPPPAKPYPDAPKPFDWKLALASLLSLFATVVSLWVAYGQRRTATDSKIHEERIKQYQAIIADTAPLAVYFPALDSEGKSRLTADACMKMGRTANAWYFAHGAMLMSTEARNAYMRFVNGLVFASQAGKPLAVPEYPNDSALVTYGRLDEYRLQVLRETDPACATAAEQEPWLPRLRKMSAAAFDRPSRGDTAQARAGYALASDALIAKWKFGFAASDDDPPYHRFRDYIFLQNLSSKLRTALAQDLRSRRRPE